MSLDNPIPAEADSHGLAALLLTETLIHALIERATLTDVEAVELTEAALSVAKEVATERADGSVRNKTTVALLSTIRDSLSLDLGRA